MSSRHRPQTRGLRGASLFGSSFSSSLLRSEGSSELVFHYDSAVDVGKWRYLDLMELAVD